MSIPIDCTDLGKEVDSLFTEWDKPDSPGCCVAVIREGQVIYQRGFGQANLEYEIPNSPRTIYHVASLSKQFTAFATHLLATEGVISLDDPVEKYIPELQDYGHPITLRQLIHHTSGLRDQWNLLGVAGWRSGDIVTEEDILKVLYRQVELNFEPGSEFQYCNSGYTLLGLIVKRVSGMSLRRFCHDRIFTPLGMSRTHFHDDHTEIVKGRAYSYSPSSLGGFQNSPLQFGNVGATSLFTTLEDMILWDRNFDSPYVGSASLIAEIQIGGMLNDGSQIGYASGLINGNYRGLRTVGHDGADAGFRTCYRRFPEQNFSVIVLANVSSIDPTDLVHRTSEVFLGSAMNPVEPTRSDSPSNSSEPTTTNCNLADYLGTYYCGELEVVNTISLSNGNLKMSFPKGMASLSPISDDVFNADPIGLMTFERVNGSVTGFRLDNGRVRRLLYVSRML